MKPTMFVSSLVVLAAGIGVWAYRQPVAAPAPAQPATSTQRAAQLVTFHEERVKRDPQGAIGWAMLAEARLDVAARRDDNNEAVAAEQAARQSLACRRVNNDRAAIDLAKALLAQHRFQDALEATKLAQELTPGDDTAKRLELELRLETGDYDAFRSSANWVRDQTDPASQALAARWELLTGKNRQAVIRLEQVVHDLRSQRYLPGSTVAWYAVQLGRALEQSARYSEAKTAFARAIDFDPESFAGKAGLARALYALGDREGAESAAKESLALNPTVGTAALLADLAAERGDADAVSRYTAVVEQVSHPDAGAFLRDGVAPKTTPHTHDRLYATYLADRGTRLDEAVQAAEKDLTARKDVYAFDTLAWTLYRAGRVVEADRAMQTALLLGTDDPKLQLHRALIDQALGRVGAEAQVAQAVEANGVLPPALQTLTHAVRRIG